MVDTVTGPLFDTVPFARTLTRAPSNALHRNKSTTKNGQSTVQQSLPPWLDQSFVEMDDSECSSSDDDDGSSLSSQDSDETMVEDDIPASSTGVVTIGDNFWDLLNQTAFTGTGLAIGAPPGLSPIPRSATPCCGRSETLPDQGEAQWNPSEQATEPNRQQRSADRCSLVRPVPVAALNTPHVVTPVRHHRRTASLALRHDAALRNFQKKQERQSATPRSREERLDLVGITSYPKPEPVVHRSPGVLCKRQEGPATSAHVPDLGHRHVRIVVDVDSEESGTDSEDDQDDGGDDRADARDASERVRASAHLLRTLSTSQQHHQCKRPRPSDGSVSRHRRPPSLDQITLRISSGGNCVGPRGPALRDGLGAQPRSVSCPPLPSHPHAHFGGVEVFVTPPTPRLSDVDCRVPGVVLRSNDAPAAHSPSVKEGRLAAPAFDLAPGRVRMIEERQRLAVRAFLAAQRSPTANPMSVVSGRPAPPEAHSAMASASFCTSGARRPDKADARWSAVDTDTVRSTTRSASASATIRRGEPLATRALADRSNSLSRDNFTDKHNSGVAATPAKYVAPGRRGYGQAGKGLPSAMPRRHGLSPAGSAGPPHAGDRRAISGRVSSACVSRAAASRSMLERLELRRSSLSAM